MRACVKVVGEALSKTSDGCEQRLEGSAARLLPANEVKITERPSGTHWCIRRRDVIENYRHEPSAIRRTLPKLLNGEHKLFSHI